MKMIDWKRVSELKNEIGASEFEEVVELFLDEVETMTSRLRASPNPDTYEEDMHFLKGCAINLGFDEFARLCLAAETLSAQGRAQEVDLESVLASYETSRAAFLEGMSAGLSA